MKKQLLLFSFLIAAICSYGQSKPEVKQPAPVYSPDMSSKHDLTLKGVSAQQLNDWVIYATNGPEVINTSEQISAGTATRIAKNYFGLSAQLKSQLDSLLARDKAKWQADTAKKSTKKQYNGTKNTNN